MFFKYIYCFMMCFAFSQTFQSRDFFISSEMMEMSARSNALGKTGMMMDNNAFWTFTNPAALSELKDIQISFTSMMSRYKEHRSIKIHDYFGDYLADASYVFNDDNYYNNGIALSVPFYLYDNLTFGFSNLPYHDFNYNYVEEVHDASFDLNKDPLVGYHIEKISGLIYNFSFGMGLKLIDNLSIGFSLNQIHSGGGSFKSPIIIERIKSVVVLEESNNLASNESVSDSIIFNLNTTNYLSFGWLMNVKNMVIALNLKEAIQMTSDNHFKYTIPSKYSFGIMLTPRQKIPASVVFEYNVQHYSNLDSIYQNFVELNDKKTFHFGIEYLNNKSPIRVGVVYQNSPFERDLNESIFTFGYGMFLNGVDIDLAANYSTITYSYPDQFIPNGDISNPNQFEKIIESNIGISISLTYDFK